MLQVATFTVRRHTSALPRGQPSPKNRIGLHFKKPTKHPLFCFGVVNIVMFVCLFNVEKEEYK